MNEEEKKKSLSITSEAYRQIFCSIDVITFWTWGVERAASTIYEGKPTLALKVHGAIHKGWVFITLGEVKDNYEVKLLTFKQEVVNTIGSVKADELGKTIDENVERPADFTDAQYKILVEREEKMKEYRYDS